MQVPLANAASTSPMRILIEALLRRLQVASVRLSPA
jgi:hypothetical protein